MKQNLLITVTIVFILILGIFVWKNFINKSKLSPKSVITNPSSSTIDQNIDDDESYSKQVTKCLNDNLMTIVEMNKVSPSIQLQNKVFTTLANKDKAQKCFSLIPEGKTYYGLLQFYGPITEENKTLVGSSYVSFVEYIPQFAYTARLSHNSLKNTEALKVVRWIGTLPNEGKIRKDLWQGHTGKNWIFDNNGLLTINLRFFKDTDAEERENIIKLHQGIIVSNSNEYYRVKIKRENIKDLATENIVAWIEPYTQPVLN